ncbi:hypothetical protein [Mesorhizobium sp. Root552]|jgi:hypothetical protein|uniref:hypothetical protein n=1 Tax=Mesorhizobium sp. Root552 TaxID=1736555 RepID=UPI0012E96256|nr:hypothetical protein [Mesorhizobium sp. Root552]
MIYALSTILRIAEEPLAVARPKPAAQLPQVLMTVFPAKQVQASPGAGRKLNISKRLILKTNMAVFQGIKADKNYHIRKSRTSNAGDILPSMA